MAYLEQEQSGQTDSMIEHFAATAGLRRYALAPQQLQHIGLRSSRDNLEINTRSTWAFWFEENDPKKLRAEHRRLLADHQMRRLLLRYQEQNVNEELLNDIYCMLMSKICRIDIVHISSSASYSIGICNKEWQL